MNFFCWKTPILPPVLSLPLRMALHKELSNAVISRILWAYDSPNEVSCNSKVKQADVWLLFTGSRERLSESEALFRD